MELKISKNNVNYFFDRFLNYCKESGFYIIDSDSSKTHFCTIGFGKEVANAFYLNNQIIVEFVKNTKNRCNDLLPFTFMSGVVENFIMAGRFYRNKVKSSKRNIEKDFDNIKIEIDKKIRADSPNIRISSIYDNSDDLTEQTGIVKPVPTQSYFFVDCNKGCDVRFRVLFDYKTKIVEVSVSDFYKRKIFDHACRENKFAVELFDMIVQSVREYFSCKEEYNSGAFL